MWKSAPLKSSFMMFAILGFLISLIYAAYGRINADWGFTLCFFFALMFVAALISMHCAPVEPQLKLGEGRIMSVVAGSPMSSPSTKHKKKKVKKKAKKQKKK
jgi:multisubunit Na+/H+ antiporter MnhB subunit